MSAATKDRAIADLMWEACRSLPQKTLTADEIIARIADRSGGRFSQSDVRAYLDSVTRQ
jgi:hypothetical protein